MPRPPRIDFPGARHHVMNHSAYRRPIFPDDRRREVFLDLLGQAVERYGVEVCGYCLLPDRFQLMVVSSRGNLSQVMAFVSSRYSRAIGCRASRDGPLFSGRFQSRLVVADSHWPQLLVHLHLGPVRASLPVALDRMQWTSHGRYLGRHRLPEWLATERLELRLTEVGGYAAFLRDVMSGRCEQPTGFARVLFGPGRDQRSLAMDRSAGAPPPSVDRALAQVSRLTGVPLAELLARRPGRKGNAARALAAWWLTCGAGLTNREAGCALQMSPSAVSKVLARIRSGPDSYHAGRLRAWFDQLRAGANAQ